MKTALSILRRRSHRVLGAGFVVFGIGALLEIPVLVLLDGAGDDHPAFMVVQIVATSFSVFGLTLQRSPTPCSGSSSCRSSASSR